VTERTRFAPTTSGPAHPGTLLAALLAWLDARSRGAHFTLRLEDVDRTRCTPASARGMAAALRWLGLDWDAQEQQSEHRAEHEAALDRLAELGLLYPCTCSRAEIARKGVRAADGGWRYGERCRAQPLPAGGWRRSDGSLRVRMPDGRIELRDESGPDLSQDVRAEMGDPVVRRRDGAIAYHLAAVVDDGRSGITRVVRGRDLATSTATHVALQRALGLPTPVYHHHFLFLESADGGRKLSKLHGSVGWGELARAYLPGELCALLAGLAGLTPGAAAVTPAALVARFDWSRVRSDDLALRWTGRELARASP